MPDARGRIVTIFGSFFQQHESLLNTVKQRRLWSSETYRSLVAITPRIIPRPKVQPVSSTSYIGVSISGWSTNYFEWSAGNRISNVLVRPSTAEDPSAGMGVGESSISKPCNWKSSGGHMRPARPHGNWECTVFVVSRIYFVSFQPGRERCRYSPRSPGYTFQWSTTRLGRILRWKSAGFHRLAESFYRYPADTQLFREVAGFVRTAHVHVLGKVRDNAAWKTRVRYKLSYYRNWDKAVIYQIAW